MPLPWGEAQDVAPYALMEHYAPDRLREQEEHERQNPGARARDETKFHNACNHVCYRRAHASRWTQFWVYLWGLGRGFSYFLLGFSLLIMLPISIFTADSVGQVVSDMLDTLYILLPLPLSCWLIGHIVVHRLPSHWIFTPSKGPLWELNRQTGMVTIFARKPGQFSQYGADGNFVRPFYEFDASVHVLPDRQGIPLYSLHLVHRYHPVAIDFMPVIGRQSSDKDSLALWDMWQNYMDTSKPLPDIPVWEEFRHLDPVTAEHDRRTGRNPRYWRDMDDAEYKEAVASMAQRVQQLDTLSRPNIMARHVLYL
ncbi:MAG: hypothetical protein ACN6P1_22600 [Pseudomonas sp.]|uniref:hypothetical protein n=1 Tax=Pseudomonas sp. TaxID=306 RepID=UPI003D14CC6E